MAEGEPEVRERKISDKVLVISIVILILAVAFLFGLRFIFKEKPALTLEELHSLNLEGKLKPAQGYIYNGFSFVKYDEFWNTEVKSPTTDLIYSMMFRFGPHDVENISVEGTLDIALFNDAQQYYATFNPLGFDGDFTAVTLAVGDFHQGMVKVFRKNPIAACDRNETSACSARPIVRCDSTDELVFSIEEDTTAKVIFDNNCIIVKGSGLDLVKAVDKALFRLYGIQ